MNANKLKARDIIKVGNKKYIFEKFIYDTKTYPNGEEEHYKYARCKRIGTDEIHDYKITKNGMLEMYEYYRRIEIEPTKINYENVIITLSSIFIFILAIIFELIFFFTK